MNQHKITNKLSVTDAFNLVSSENEIVLSEESEKRIIDCKNYLESVLSSSDAAIYGINTGFGSLCDTQISYDDLHKLQENLLLSHACGMGNKVPKPIVKLMLLLKVQSLSYGHSGVNLATVKKLITLYNKNILPVVYEKGSLGASGDLAPLAHLALPLIGEGEVYDGENIVETKEVINSPINLEAKEGLALINGTQFMAAYGVHCINVFSKLFDLANQIAAMSVEAFDGMSQPFSKELHDVRPHEGQLYTSKAMRDILEGSSLIAHAKAHVQDPYSFRCIPQVHGASYDVLQNVKRVFETEINSVTDNPNIFEKEGKILSGGNFHGQVLAMHLDFLTIAISEMANISERRIYKLVSGERGLPQFLVKNPGLNSGFMIPQYTAASIVNKNKVLCHPASSDSIVSSNGQEDHVSMGATSAVKCLEVLENCMEVLSLELMVAAQALDFREKEKSSKIVFDLHKDFRDVVEFVENDKFLHPLIMNSLNFIKGKLDIA